MAGEIVFSHSFAFTLLFSICATWIQNPHKYAVSGCALFTDPKDVVDPRWAGRSLPKPYGQVWSKVAQNGFYSLVYPHGSQGETLDSCSPISQNAQIAKRAAMESIDFINEYYKFNTRKSTYWCDHIWALASESEGQAGWRAIDLAITLEDGAVQMPVGCNFGNLHFLVTHLLIFSSLGTCLGGAMHEYLAVVRELK